MTQDNRYTDGVVPPVQEAVVTETTYATVPTTTPPVYEAVEPIRRPHPGLIPLAISSLLGLLSLFLPFAGLTQAFNLVRQVGNRAVGTQITEHTLFHFWNIGNGHHWWLLLFALATAVLALIAYATRAAWARTLAGVLGLITGLWLLVSAFRFSHAAFGHFFGNELTGNAGLTSGWGRWIMVLAGLALLATAIWSLLRGAGDAAEDAVATATNTYNA